MANCGELFTFKKETLPFLVVVYSIPLSKGDYFCRKWFASLGVNISLNG